MRNQLRQHLDTLQQVMISHQLWETVAPSEEALNNDQPFGVGIISPTQWLQWIFIPRMHALLDANAPLPMNFAITPYLEEALKYEAYLMALNAPLLRIETLLKSE